MHFLFNGIWYHISLEIISWDIPFLFNGIWYHISLEIISWDIHFLFNGICYSKIYISYPILSTKCSLIVSSPELIFFKISTIFGCLYYIFILRDCLIIGALYSYSKFKFTLIHFFMLKWSNLSHIVSFLLAKRFSMTPLLALVWEWYIIAGPDNKPHFQVQRSPKEWFWYPGLILGCTNFACQLDWSEVLLDLV